MLVTGTQRFGGSSVLLLQREIATEDQRHLGCNWIDQIISVYHRVKSTAQDSDN